jgi:DNA repair exonuclease SbcCD ATPase subunit
MEKEIQKMHVSVDIIAKNTAYILENMATKKDLEAFKLETNTHFNNRSEGQSSVSYPQKTTLNRVVFCCFLALLFLFGIL